MHRPPQHDVDRHDSSDQQDHNTNHMEHTSLCVASTTSARHQRRVCQPEDAAVAAAAALALAIRLRAVLAPQALERLGVSAPLRELHLLHVQLRVEEGHANVELLDHVVVVPRDAAAAAAAAAGRDTAAAISMSPRCTLLLVVREGLPPPPCRA